MKTKIRKKIEKALDTLSEENLEAVLDYLHILQEPEEVEPTEEEKKAIAEGEEAFARGEYVRWRDVKTDAVRCPSHKARSKSLQ